MTRWLKPSLRRRVVFALLIAFFLVAIVLAARQYLASADPDRLDAVVADFGRGVMAQLDGIDDPAEARGVVEALESQINRGYREAGLPSTLALQLWDRQGGLVHGSREGIALPWTGAVGIHRVDADGRHVHVFRAEGVRWRIAVGQPELARTWVLRSIVSDLAVSMLIAFPFVLVPVWIAVSQGLRPLRQLSQCIAARSPDDLDELGVSPRHAELNPLVGSIDGLMRSLRIKVQREHAFVHDAAHELRTPMAVVSAQAHALAHVREPRERLEAAARMEGAIARASNLVEQLLQLARFDGQAVVRTSLDLVAVIQEELAHLEPQAFARRLELSLDAPDELPWIVELGAFRAIVQNLVGNAIRYVPEGGHVVVGMAKVGDRLHLGVEDDGPGIPEDQREKVFERFVRGPDHEVPGSGLGLAIVRQAASRLGATVRLLEGLPNGSGRRGCRFEVIFVRAGRQPGAAPAGKKREGD
jgi:signal transduction histidine kinase